MPPSNEESRSADPVLPMNSEETCKLFWFVFLLKKKKKKRAGRQAKKASVPCSHSVRYLPELEGQSSHQPPHSQEEWAHGPDSASSQVPTKEHQILAKQTSFQRSGELLEAARLLG